MWVTDRQYSGAPCPVDKALSGLHGNLTSLSLLNPTSSPFPSEVIVPNKLLAPQTPSQYLLPVNPTGQTPHLTFSSTLFCPGTNIGTGAFCSQQFTYTHSLIHTQRKRFQIIHVLRGKTLYTTCKCIFILIKNT